MSREFLKVDKVPDSVKEELAKMAFAKFGTLNASLMVRSLISEAVCKDNEMDDIKGRVIDLSELEKGKTVVRLSIPTYVFELFTRVGDVKKTPVNYLMVSVLMSYFNHHNLAMDEIGELRKSNEELVKLNGSMTAVKQSLNELIESGKLDGNGVLAMTDKISKEIKKHVNLALKILDHKTFMWENRNSKQDK